ncbi:MAG: SDR family oxidoreductase [Ignavibacteria bacterium]|nr:SDR family oxidoreductase [Ignavibacteria bacterium]OIO16862.1 MAG: NAD-dependent dehydratase [Ignavibacteria bacterium CG1_02_37_35]PIX94706.1 MAG: NAD-dependent dehydratase [Ignavibacteria bacterium CG_4_10_14_3_um_filter_37_18]
MRILFIGGTGVISTACSELCIDNGYDLYLLNRGQSLRVPPAKAKIINADIRDTRAVKTILAKKKFDVVVDWIAYTEEHVKNDFEIFGDKTYQYIFISSASAYHKPPLILPITEDTPLHNPFWTYSQGKIDCENFLMKLFTEENFPVTICRPSHTYDKTRFPLYGNYTAFSRMKQNKSIIIHGDGNTLWTLTNTRDFAKGFIGLLGNSKCIGEAYHITSDETMTWNQIAETIALAARLELKITHIPAEFITKYDEEWGSNITGDKGYDTVFNNSKIRSIIPQFKAVIPYREGIKEVIAWYSEPKNQLVNSEIDLLMDKMIAEYG